MARLVQASLHKARSPAAAFHDMLRERERTMTQQHPAAGVARARASASVVSVPPVVGSVRTFDVCANTACTSFVQSTATAKVVGQRVAIYLDDGAPAGFTSCHAGTECLAGLVPVANSTRFVIPSPSASLKSAPAPVLLNDPK